ncbi:MAG: alpha-ketoglutarate-dependent dioxygenase AlkB [Halieaceae bacterium]|jgi:alkylated DNA repair dioxygenase AlkB|nr:alpha-ketoglutarate-dependent dioxygenase AlkB [Halieaceae bacterium]
MPCPVPTPGEPESLPLPDGELLLYTGLRLGCREDSLLRRLIDDVDWRQEHVTLFGKTHKQPRLVAWYGDREARYRYSGKTYDPHPWDNTLLRLKALAEQASASRFNSVLLNYYRDGRDAMGLHADDEPELGPEPVIASLSLGATRTLYFRHRFRRELATVNVPLPSGSLLVMRGATQRNWKHGIRKLSRPCGPRINLTFRQILRHQGTLAG